MIKKQLEAYKAYCLKNRLKPQEYSNLKEYSKDVALWKAAARANGQAFETYLYETIEQYKEQTKHGATYYDKPLATLEAIYKGVRK